MFKAMLKHNINDLIMLKVYNEETSTMSLTQQKHSTSPVGNYMFKVNNRNG